MGKRKHPNTLLHIAPNMGLKKIASLTSKDVDKICYFTLWKTFYEDKHNFVEFVGHPLIDAIQPPNSRFHQI
jgi:lipid A disaccharide synthetase